MKHEIQRVEKPWGYELRWATTQHYLGKVLHIRKGERLSLQLHRMKHETILVYSGRMTLVVDDEAGRLREIPLGVGDTHHIPAGRRHRMIAVDDCDVVEVSTAHPDDVVRLEDDYGRAASSDVTGPSR